jgi:hypothetical protein
MDAAVLRQIGHSLFVAELPDPLPGQTSKKNFCREETGRLRRNFDVVAYRL